MTIDSAAKVLELVVEEEEDYYALSSFRADFFGG